MFFSQHFRRELRDSEQLRVSVIILSHCSSVVAHVVLHVHVLCRWRVRTAGPVPTPSSSSGFVMCEEWGFAWFCWETHGHLWKRCGLEGSVFRALRAFKNELEGYFVWLQHTFPLMPLSPGMLTPPLYAAKKAFFLKTASLCSHLLVSFLEKHQSSDHLCLNAAFIPSPHHNHLFEITSPTY